MIVKSTGTGVPLLRIVSTSTVPGTTTTLTIQYGTAAVGGTTTGIKEVQVLQYKYITVMQYTRTRRCSTVCLVQVSSCTRSTVVPGGT